MELTLLPASSIEGLFRPQNYVDLSQRVRSQTKAIMGKLGVGRQFEIVRAVLATAVLDGRS